MNSITYNGMNIIHSGNMYWVCTRMFKCLTDAMAYTETINIPESIWIDAPVITKIENAS